MDMNQLVEMQQSLTFLGSIGGLALALLGAGLAAVLISLPNAWAPCDIGFQLSFCGVLGVQLSGRLGEWQRQRLLPEGEDDARTWRYRVMERALRILEAVETAAVGMSSSALALPISDRTSR